MLSHEAAEKLSDDFKDVKFIPEPYKDLKEQSKNLMYEYFMKNGKLIAAEQFKPD